MKKIIISIVLVLALLVSFPAVPAFSYSAPAVYVDWNIGGTADVLSVDWRCTTDSVSTYWAVSQFDDGYAGFQTLGNGQHVIIMSLWNLNNNTTKPTVEYAKDNNGADFGGEGEGKKVITSYNWKVGTWYTMRIQLRREGGKSYYEQWVREGNGPWEITAVISYPVSNRTFRYVLAFQEDFWDSGPNKRSAEVKNAYARMINTGAWKSLNRYELSNYGSALNRNTYWALVSNGTAVSFAAGGNTTPASGQTNPQFFTVNQPASPAETSWLPKLPPGGVPISRVRVNSWETSSPDKYTARCLFDGNENTFWHAKWSQGSGSIGKGEAFVDIDLGSVKTITKIELDKRVRSNGYDPIKSVRLFSHGQTGNTYPNGEAMSSYVNANVATSQINSDFSMTGWTQAANPAVQGLTSANAVRQTVTVTLNQPITARYVRLGVTCQDTAAGGNANGYAQVSEIRVFENGGAVNAAAPAISAQPKDTAVNTGQSAPLSVTASVPRGALSYQWYSASSKTNTGGTAISGATGPSYSAPTNALGTRYYYCVVTNTDSAATGVKSASTASSAASVTVQQPGSHTQLAISRVRVNSWETSSPDTYTARCLFDGNENTFWHAKWYQGSGSIGKGEAFVDIDLGSVKTISKIELDKRVRSNGYDPIKSVRLFSHSQTGNTFPNGETMSSYTATNVSVSQINSDFSMTGWSQAANPAVLGQTTANTVRQTVTVTLSQPITARYVRLGVTCQDTAAGGNATGYAQVSEIRVFESGGAANAATPAISAQPKDLAVSTGQSAPLSVTATVPRGTLSYQWYSASSKTNTGGTAVSGATGPSYSAPTNAAGTRYYYCVVTNTDSAATGVKSASIASGAASVTVQQPGSETQLAISRVRVNSWETSSPDTYTARCLFDGNENTFWHAKWNRGSGSIGKGEAFVDIDLGSVKTITKIELDKRVRSNGYDPIKGVRALSHSQTGNTFPNGETMSSYTAANVSTSQINSDFSMTGWTQAANPSVLGLTSVKLVRQTVTVTLSQPITARYVRLGVTCQDSVAGGSVAGYAQVSEIRVFGN